MDDASNTRRPDRRRIIPFALLAFLAAASGVVAAASVRATGGVMGPEGVVIRDVPDFAGAGSTLKGQTVDGIRCVTEANEVVKYHIHSYVSIYVNGSERRLPAGIGITSPALIEHTAGGPFYDVGLYNCIYWVHTHTYDGIVHVEAPAKATFTLGQLFDVWHRALSSSRVGSQSGPVTVFENGRRVTGDPRAVTILPHSVIQIDVGQVVPFRPVTYKVTGACGQGTNSCSTTK
jgi:hypothetical protein